MVSKYEKQPLQNRLNITEQELRWLEGRAEAKHLALAELCGDARLASSMVMRTREFLLSGGEWNQYGTLNATEILEDYRWQPVLEWLAGHPYALLVGDKQLIPTKKKREKVDIEYALGNEAPKEWIGPHRYNPEISLFLQRNRAEEEGINCQVAVHLVAEALRHPLQREERSGELFENYRVFDPSKEQLEIGDVLFFHERPAISDPKSLHLTTCIGWDMAGVPLLLHATHQAIKTRPAAEIVPITQLLTNRTRFCYGAVRLITK